MNRYVLVFGMILAACGDNWTECDDSPDYPKVNLFTFDYPKAKLWAPDMSVPNLAVPNDMTQPVVDMFQPNDLRNPDTCPEHPICEEGDECNPHEEEEDSSDCVCGNKEHGLGKGHCRGNHDKIRKGRAWGHCWFDC